MNTREKVLQEALNCVNGEREKQYGNPEDNFKRIADLWSVYLTSIFDDVVVELEPIDVAKMMILFKIARANGPKDKLDNYVDIIGYAACAAEIFESETEENKVAESRSCSKKAFDNIKDFFEQVAQGYSFDIESGTVTNNKKEVTEECKTCAKKDKPDGKCNINECGQFDACMTAYQHYIYNKTKEAREAIDECMCDQVNKDPYSYFHDKLANYVSVKAKEEHIPLENLPRELEELLDQASTDCVINGKRVIDCYKEIDEMFAKHRELSPYRVKKKSNDNKNASFWGTYKDISDYITSSSKKAEVNPSNVVRRLVENGHVPTCIASLLHAGKLGFDDFFALVDDAINEVKKETNVDE